MNQNNNMSENLNFMRENIMSRLNLDYLPDADKAKLLDSMAQAVEQKVLLHILNILNEIKRDELGDLLESGDDKSIEKFMAENVPNFLEIVQSEIESVSKELESLVKK